MASEAFQSDVIELIRKYYPAATKGGIDDCAGAAHDLSMSIGAMVAFAFRLNGQVVGRTILQSIIKNIIENAAAIDPKSEQMIRDEIKKISLQ